MSDIDLNQLVEPLTEEGPCGPDMEYEPAFGELDRAAKPKPEKVMGKETIPGEEPSWSDVRGRSLELLGKSKDLRVAVHLTRALTETQGLAAFADGLSLIHQLLEKFWDEVHPKLDESDKDAATFRVNSLLPLADPDVVLRSVRRAPLAASKTMGSFSLRDIRLAKGEISLAAGDKTTVADPAVIDAAFMDGELDSLQSAADAVSQAVDTVPAIESLFVERIGATDTPDLSLLAKDLTDIQTILREQLGRRGVSDDDSAQDVGGAAQARSTASGEVNTRDDVIRLLDKMCDYFRRHEPSSPVPLLLQRAKRLVAKDFMEILKDLTPDAVAQAKVIGGVDGED